MKFYGLVFLLFISANLKAQDRSGEGLNKPINLVGKPLKSGVHTRYLDDLKLCEIPKQNQNTIAREEDPEYYLKSNKNLITIIGFSLLAGAQNFQIKQLNADLNRLGIPKLAEDAGAIEWRYFTFGNDFITGTSYYRTVELSQREKFTNQNSKFNYVNLNGKYFGGDLTLSLINKRKWEIRFPSVGLNYSNFQLKIDSVSKVNAVSFGNIIQQKRASTVLNSNGNINIKVEAELNYKTGWFKKDVYEIKFGLNSGYIIPLQTNPWQLDNSTSIIPDLAVINKGSYCLLVKVICVMLELKTDKKDDPARMFNTNPKSF